MADALEEGPLGDVADALEEGPLSDSADALEEGPLRDLADALKDGPRCDSPDAHEEGSSNRADAEGEGRAIADATSRSSSEADALEDELGYEGKEGAPSVRSIMSRASGGVADEDPLRSVKPLALYVA